MSFKSSAVSIFPRSVIATGSGLTCVAPRFAAELTEGVHWDCVQPRARVELRMPDGRTLRGRGYAEVLSLSIAPWRLPIHELRWGRFAGERHGAVWIEWLGPHPLKLVLLDGARVDAMPPLRLSDEVVLRSGRIGETALRLLPRRLPGLGLEETKWRSRGELALPGEPPDRGWAIHEVVRWPR